MILAATFAAFSAVGVLQGVAGWVRATRFVRAQVPEASGYPPITVLKPLHGDEPLLTEALETLCTQDYPGDVQIVCGVASHLDPAVRVVSALRARYPQRDIQLIADHARHGTNPKIGNLINMFPAARHDIIAIADSDVHARPDYLRRLVDTLVQPGIGLVTTLYTGLPAVPALAAHLGAAQINWTFLPGALLGRALGRRDCLGATMCLRRETLARIGGLEALKDHLADDNVLGRLVRAADLDIGLAHTIVATTVAERSLPVLWRHELRWARTIRTLEPAGFAASLLQYPLFWAALVLIAAAGAPWAWVFGLGVWAVRALTATGLDRTLRPMLSGLAFDGRVWLLPLRDMISVVEWIASHAGRRVDWRGSALQADTPPRFAKGSHPR